MPTDAFNSPSEALSVSDLNNLVKQLLEESIGRVWIAGEVSNLVSPASGHLYFSLKDSQAQVRCALFRQAKLLVKGTIKDGSQILACAKVSLYPNRGDYQLIIEQVEPLGEGLLRQAFDALKQKLNAEGLFSPQHKKPVPIFSQCVGIITSPSGAAVRDIISVFQRRFPSIELKIYPTLVQGKEAPSNIVHAIACANERNECDALILARGGGSLEDLWAFNHEDVARAVFASCIPIVVGVGHETDFSIADFVADIRAPTPSAAAELLSPDKNDIVRRLQVSETKLGTLVFNQIRACQGHLEHLSKRLRHPRDQLQDKIQKSDELSMRMENAMHQGFQYKQSQLKTAHLKLEAAGPDTHVQRYQQRRQHLQDKLLHGVEQRYQQRKNHFSQLCGLLHALSPLHTLERGYAIAKSKSGKVLRNANAVLTGDEISIRLAKGLIKSQVTETQLEGELKHETES